MLKSELNLLKNHKKLFRFSIKAILLFIIIGSFNASFANSFSYYPFQVQQYYTEQFQLDEGSNRYYVFTLRPNQTLVASCTAQYKGTFYLFLYDFRPTQSIVLDNGSLNSDLVNKAIAYNVTPGKIFSDDINDTVCYITLSFTSSKERVYYLEVVLVNEGPDTFIIQANIEMDPYFIPFIDGYNLYWLVLLSSSSIIIILKLKLKVKKVKIKKQKNSSL